MSIFSRPQFFDIFGFIGFIYILAFSVWALNVQTEIPMWALMILFAIGVIGFIVDGMIVYTSYLKKK